MTGILNEELMSSLSGKIALVTGASRGIGASVARMLADQGADIVINYHSKASRAESTAADVLAVGRRALLTQADLTNADEVTAMIEAVRREYGRLDVLVLNASGGLEKDKPADYAMQLNLYSAGTACRHGDTIDAKRRADRFCHEPHGALPWCTAHWRALRTGCSEQVRRRTSAARSLYGIRESWNRICGS